jgi:hypothetical protein
MIMRVKTTMPHGLVLLMDYSFGDPPTSFLGALVAASLKSPDGKLNYDFISALLRRNEKGGGKSGIANSIHFKVP